MLVKLDELEADISAALLAMTAVDDPDVDLQQLIDDTILLLQRIQNAMLLQSEQDMLDALKPNQDGLAELSKDMAAFAKKLGAAAETVKNISDTVGTVVSVLGVVISTGII